MNPEQLRRWRLKRGWTQAEAAEWYGCSEREWRRFECEDVKIPQPLLNRIAAEK